MEHYRNCPQCGKQIAHKTEHSRNSCAKSNKWCRSCRASEINKRPGLRDEFVARYATTNSNAGKNNPFYGKKHTNDSIDLMRANRDVSKYQTDDFRRKMLEVVAKGVNHPMHGKTTLQVWIEKYGEEKARELDVERRRKWSEANSGSKNPMYGKPTPQGSGNGWSGWYKGWYFRSLHELTYVIQRLEPNENKWISGDRSGVRIKYLDWAGSEKTYVPDFLVDDIRLVEIKPAKLHNTPAVKLKTEAAERFCRDVGFVYELVDPGLADAEVIKKLHSEGKVIFLDRYEEMFNERYNS